MKSKVFTLFAALVLLFSAQASAQTNGDVNGDGVVNEQDITAILEIMQQAGGVKEKTKYYWYVGNDNPMDNGMATNIDTSALTFTLNKSHSLLQTATNYTDLIGKEFPAPNHFVIPTEWFDKVQIVNANNAPWAKGTIVSDTTNNYTWCWNPASGTGTFKIIAK